MLESLMARFNRLVCRHPYATLLLGLVATIVSLVASQRLTLKTDFVDLLPQELPSVQALHSLQQEFGGSRYHTIIIEHQNRDAAIRFMQDFSQKIAVLPQVFYLETEKPARFFERRALWYLTKDELQSVDERIQTYVSQHKLGASPFWGQMLNLTDEAAPLDFSDIEQKYAKQFGLGEGNAVGSIYYENADQTLLAFLVKPKDDAVGLSESRKFLQEMKTIEQNLSPKSYDSSIRVGYTGDYQMLIDQHHYISQEIFKITLIVLIALCVVVFLYYSRLSSLILLFIPLVLSMIWAAGLTSVSLGSINIITSLSGCVLLGLGSDYGIYLLDRFYQERKQGLSVEEACAHAFSKTGRATFAAFLTTAAAYVALMLARFKAFSEFGWIGILGIGMSLFAMFTVLPALICIAEKHRLFAFEQHWSLKLIPTLALKKLLPPLPVLGVFAVLMVGTFFSAAPLSMEYDTDKMTSYNFKLETKELEEKADQIFDYKLRPSVFVAENAEHEHEILTALNKRAAEKPDLFYRIFALDSLLPKEQASKYNLMRQIQNHWKKIPSEVIRKKYTNIFDPDFTQLTRESLPLEVKRYFLSPEADSSRSLVYVISGVDRSFTDNVKAFGSAVDNVELASGKHIRAADGWMISYDIMRMVDSEALFLALATIGFIVLLLTFDLRNFGKIALVFGGFATGILSFIAVLMNGNVHLNIFNISVIPIVLGTGINAYIHLYYRYAEDRAFTLVESFNHIVPSIALSSLTTLIGFAGFILSANIGLRSIGIVGSLGIIATLTASLLMFPAMLELRIRRSAVKGKELSGLGTQNEGV